MIQMMMSTIGGSSATRGVQRQALMLRKFVGFAMVSSGLAVIVAHALQHAFGA
ncbi:hypothetical protein [Paraburkholderia domus]|uniref:hypothetical protein n=1 Tax=Paraburkholderia domus TaxID=2793075 RepID=UPI001B2A472E|nr:hypothetical protein [Paraburkholderia domus]CAE6776276.1 hypothetical protein R75483_04238 [Paraburkholderia domus]